MSKNNHEKNVQKFYDSFDPSATSPSRLTFYKNLKVRFPELKVPETTSKLTFGCANPITYLLEEIEFAREGMNGSYSILDAGGGAGFDSFLLKQILPNSNILNIDISRNLLKHGALEFDHHLGAKVNRHGNNVSFICCDINKLPIRAAAKFDFIISNAALNLIEGKSAVLKSFEDPLKDDGSLFLCDVAFAENSSPPKAFYSHDISEGTFFAPTIINELEYSRMIFDSYNFKKTFERHEITPKIAGMEDTAFAIFCSQIKKLPPFQKDSFNCDCGEKLDIKAIIAVNIEESPVYLKMIRDEELNSVRCHKCAKLFTDFIPFFFEWPEKAIYLHVFPASLKSREAEFKSQIRMLPHHEKNPSLIFGQRILVQMLKEYF